MSLALRGSCGPPASLPPQAVIEAVLEDRLPPQVATLNRGLGRAWKVWCDCATLVAPGL